MKRLILRVAVLVTVLALGIIAIAYAQRGSADVRQDADAATGNAANDGDASGPPRLLPASENVNPLRPRRKPSPDTAQTDAVPAVGVEGKSSRSTVITVAGSEPPVKPFDPFGPLTSAVTPGTQGGAAVAGGKDISLDPPANTVPFEHGAALDPGKTADTKELRASERRLKASQLFLNTSTRGANGESTDVRPPFSSAAPKDLGPSVRVAAPILNPPARTATAANGGLRSPSLSPATNINLTSGTGSDSAGVSAATTPNSAAIGESQARPATGADRFAEPPSKIFFGSRAGTVQARPGNAEHEHAPQRHDRAGGRASNCRSILVARFFRADGCRPGHFGAGVCLLRRRA